MEEFEQWRISQGYGRSVPKFSKSTKQFYISDEALNGLTSLAKNLQFISRDKVSVSLLIEAIGLHTLVVQPLHQDERSGYVDEDGLTEDMCFAAGLRDWNAKKAPSFYDDAELSGGRKRSRYFLNAYILGYSAGFLDSNLSSTPSFERTLED